MKKAVLTWDFSPFRLLPLLLVIVLSIIGVNAVHGPSGSRPFLIRQDFPKLQDGSRFERAYQLASRCREYVQIKGGRKVKANGKKKSKFTHLMLDSLPNKLISIRGSHRHQYICFNNKGKLILRHRETSSCLFKQLLTPDRYIEFQSVKNPRWYIGFNKKGRPLRGYSIARRKRRKCFQFVMTRLSEGTPTPSPTSWSPPFEFKNVMNRFRKRHKG